MKKENNAKLLGILGGLGPMSGVYFCEMLISHTDAKCDSEHINFIMSSRADTPDRSSYIMGKSPSDPSLVMAEEAKRLQCAGADLLAIPCNTAHHFYRNICNAVDIPILNIIEQAALFCKHECLSKVGVLATEGTVMSGAYSDMFSPMGIKLEQLTEDEQTIITKVIFDQIKSGKEPDYDEFMSVAHALRKRGCQRLILGCTELSLIKKYYPLPEYFTDSLELLAISAIKATGRRPIGFEPSIMNFYGFAEKGS